jgi:pSer/pThr/pTyr-binding forkhead associated (FHA) protein
MVVSDSVSRRHAEIIKDKNDFFLKDSESKYGTFVPIGVKNRTQIYEGDVIAFEDHEVEVLRYKFYKSNNTFDLKIRRRGEKETIGNFFSKKYVMVGREGREICINEPTISPTHARITFDASGQLIIQE